MRNLLLSLFKKEQCEWFVLLLWKTRDLLKKVVVFTMFLTIFHCFSPFYAQEQMAPGALHSVALFKELCERLALVALYKRANGSDLLPSLFKKERNRDSFFKKERNRDSHFKKEQNRDSHFKKERITILRENLVIHSKNQRAKSQSW